MQRRTRAGYIEEVEIPYFLERQIQTRSDPTAAADHCVACREGEGGAELRPCAVVYPGGGPSGQSTLRLCSECAATLHHIAAVARQVFVRVDEGIADATRRWLEYGREVEFAGLACDVAFPLRVYALLFDARRAFLHGIDTASIVCSSAAVELALNRDTRRPASSWQNLSLRHLLLAATWGSPVDQLLEPSERPPFHAGILKTCQFITYRNKYAHGEGAAGVKHPPFFVRDLQRAEHDQLLAAQRFLCAWGVSVGNPIVRQDDEWRQAKHVPGTQVNMELSVHARALDVGWSFPKADDHV